MILNLDAVEWLSPPYEIYEFQPCNPATFSITDYKIGKIRISPRWPGAPTEKIVIAIRLFVKPETKPAFPYYYDITPSRLVHQLASMLVHGVPHGMRLRIHRDIPGPKAHFSVEWVP
jgi:hypothetical protein